MNNGTLGNKWGLVLVWVNDIEKLPKKFDSRQHTSLCKVALTKKSSHCNPRHA